MQYHVVRAVGSVLVCLLFAVAGCGDNLEPPPVDADETDGSGLDDGAMDCDGGSCAEPTCTDGVENGTETDIDCGGDCAPGRRCGDGLGCADGDDCQSGVCAGQLCAAPACGDGVRQGDEACDDGNHTNGDGCDDGTGGNCRPSGCGNGTRSGSEECDDGNNTNGDGCDNNCTNTGCGNGVITSGEVCDDDDAMGGDGCSATCQVEAGYTCSMVPSVCVGMCGDGVRVGTEQCDDAPPAENGDGCSITCTQEPGYTCTGSPSVCTTMCGDGVRAGTEGCDDAPPAESGDGCNATCFVEPGWVCVGTPSLCFPICGDGRVVGTEACDDPAPAENGDGCSAQCLVETGYQCMGSPSVCGPRCGDGLKLPGEACDDAPPAEAGDGCSATCTIESGWTCMGTMPSTCTTTCGDGIRAGTEECDDAPPAENNDGCSSTCTVESGYMCAGAMPSTCATVCGDGLVRPGEGCDDAPPAEDGDGCNAMCQVETGYVCNGEPSTCQITCGDGDLDAGEACDDGRNDDGDGCAAACVIEFGFTCSATTPSVCASTCGDGIKASNEQCDDAPPAENGDGCSATCTIDPGYTCTGVMPTVCATRCGDGVRAGVEQCDDGCGPGTPGVCDAGDNGDGCTQTCTLECGNGTLNPSIEQCDDGNRNAGDGCSPTCTFEVSCAPGQNLVQINSTDVPKAIPDSTPAGVDSTAAVPAASQGAIRKAVVGVARIDHTFEGDITLSLVSPAGRSRNLIVRRGSSNDNFINMRFDDAAPTSITSAASPFTGVFQPEQTISSFAGFGSQSAAGTWKLHAVDAASGDTGSIIGWTLSLCVDPAAYCTNGTIEVGEECDDGNTSDADLCNNQCLVVDGCGDGNLDSGEQCDDDNVTSGDGCSATCTVELTCGAGETPVLVTDLSSQAIADDNAFHDFPAAVSATGGVRKAVVFLRQATHTNDNQLDIQLASPGSAMIRDLSSDNGSTNANYIQTMFDDTASTAITSGSAPFTGRFKPEQSLSTTAFTDFRDLNATGTWNLQVRDDTSGTVGTLNGWTLGLCVSGTAAYCGDGSIQAGEECDDANTNNTDACSNLCQLVDGCGDGNIDAGEQCDDNNLVSGDGCSSTCQLDITCGPGETPVIVSDPTSQAIADDQMFHDFNISVGLVGSVQKATVYIAGITHPNTGHLDIQLASPNLVVRNLSDDNGTTANYAQTLFDDAASTAITSGSVPFSGRFRPEQSLSTTGGVDLRNVGAGGTWHLQIRDDTAMLAGTLNGWSLALCVNETAGYCGDNMINAAGEECDDGNSNNADACSSTCQIVDGCGDGNIDAGEQCDDNNIASGDGCSATCQLDIACGVGETPVIVTNATSIAIPDSNSTGVLSSIDVPTSGVVRKVIAGIDVTHTYDSDLDIVLLSPYGVQRELTTSNGSGVANFRRTLFSDTASTPITSGSAPYTGTFRPEESISDAAGFANQSAAGRWNLHVWDHGSGDTGTLNQWSVALCIDTSVSSVCGNGYVEASETCDDGGATPGDGCSAACQVELTCSVGSPVIVRSSAASVIVPDNSTAGVSMPLMVNNAGTVRKAIVVLGAITHNIDGELDISLVSPMSTAFDLSSGNGSSGDDYVSTALDDGAPTAVTAGSAPFRGQFRPEAALTGVNGQAASGTWSLKVADHSSGDSGVLQSWVLGLCVE